MSQRIATSPQLDTSSVHRDVGGVSRVPTVWAGSRSQAVGLARIITTSTQPAELLLQLHIDCGVLVSSIRPGCCVAVFIARFPRDQVGIRPVFSPFVIRSEEGRVLVGVL